MKVAYTVDHCWLRVPGGTSVAAVEVAAAITASGAAELRGVAAHHRRAPILDPRVPVDRLWPRTSRQLAGGWLWLGRPRVEAATGDVDVTHATSLITPGTTAPLVVTVHDLAVLRYPEMFNRRGALILRRAIEVLPRRARLVLCSSQATMDDCSGLGIEPARLRLVPLGVRPIAVEREAVAAARERFGLPERYVLFVGTVEPRKNLPRLVEAMGMLEEPLPLAVVGPVGWGDVEFKRDRTDVRILGKVSDDDRNALYAGAAVCCYPSIWEGFGLPVLESMAAGTPVVTSRGISTEEVAGGAAVLVDPRDPADIARGIADALRDTDLLRAAGLARAAQQTWARTAELTVSAYREVAPR